MILNKSIDADHLCVKDNKYVVDTNVLLYMYNEKFFNDDPRMKEMARILSRAMDLNCDIYVPLIAISEFIRVCHNRYFEDLCIKAGKRLNYKKDYRNTKEFKSNNEFIYKTIKENIFDRLKPISDNFSSLNFDEIFNLSNADFNDDMLMAIANDNSAYLISSDRDTIKIPGVKKNKRRKK